MTIINTQNFEDMTKSGTVVVDFFATWCGPCTAVSPLIEQLSEQYKDKISVYKLDVDESPEIAAKFQVMSIPTVIFFKDGEMKNSILGAQPLSRYTDAVDEVLK